MHWSGDLRGDEQVHGTLQAVYPADKQPSAQCDRSQPAGAPPAKQTYVAPFTTGDERLSRPADCLIGNQTLWLLLWLWLRLPNPAAYSPSSRGWLRPQLPQPLPLRLTVTTIGGLSVFGDLLARDSAFFRRCSACPHPRCSCPPLPFHGPRWPPALASPVWWQSPPVFRQPRRSRPMHPPTATPRRKPPAHSHPPAQQRAPLPHKHPRARRWAPPLPRHSRLRQRGGPQRRPAAPVRPTLPRSPTPVPTATDRTQITRPTASLPCSASLRRAYASGCTPSDRGRLPMAP